ncbi:MAG: ATP synthase F1 subunit epsilon [Cytophagales bacterium]
MVMQLLIVTPTKTIFDHPVASVSLPGLEGVFQVLPGHAPLVSQLKAGQVLVKREASQQSFKIAGGFAEVNKNSVRVLTTVMPSMG